MSGSTMASSLAEKVTSGVGDVAGAVADPKTALQRLKKSLSSPTILISAAAIAAAYLIGRRAARH